MTVMEPLRIDTRTEDAYRASFPWHRRILKNRSEFPTRAWESTGIASEQLLPVLDVIAKQLNLPNHFILPDDSLSILLIPDYDVFQSPGSRLGCARASVWHTALTSLRVWLRTAP